MSPSSHKGYVLITVLIMMQLLMILGFYLLSSVERERQLLITHWQTRRAGLQAEAASQEGLSSY
jgi:Tfp pilus assembly protein PilX